MAKEYFNFQNEHFEFDDSNFRLTVVSDNSQGKTISVQTLTELQFMSQVYSFRSNVLRSRAAMEELSASPMMGTSDTSTNALSGPQFESSTEEVFTATKASALDFITTI